jgi:hypothetical protein
MTCVDSDDEMYVDGKDDTHTHTHTHTYKYTHTI